MVQEIQAWGSQERFIEGAEHDSLHPHPVESVPDPGAVCARCLDSHALRLLWAFFAQMDMQTSQSYPMAIVAPVEQTAMASAATVSHSAGLAVGPSVGTTLGLRAPFLVGGVVKIVYDLTLWRMFRQARPRKRRQVHKAPKHDGAAAAGVGGAAAKCFALLV
jgi:hypothetical protein